MIRGSGSVKRGMNQNSNLSLNQRRRLQAVANPPTSAGRVAPPGLQNRRHIDPKQKVLDQYRTNPTSQQRRFHAQHRNAGDEQSGLNNSQLSNRNLQQLDGGPFSNSSVINGESSTQSRPLNVINYKDLMDPKGVEMQKQLQMRKETQNELQAMQNRIKLLQTQEQKIKTRSEAQNQKMKDMAQLKEKLRKDK